MAMHTEYPASHDYQNSNTLKEFVIINYRSY